MLGEAFLIDLLYKEQKYAKFCKPFMCKKTEKETWKKKILDREENSLSSTEMENQETARKESVTEQNDDTDQIKSVDETTVAKCKVGMPLGHSPVIGPLETLPTSKLLNRDESQEKSMLFQKQPLSNSMLNTYMERKVDELYKQLLEENLTRCHSITNLMASNLLMNNVNYTSLQISQEQNVELWKDQEAILHSLPLCNLCNSSHGKSSEFSTPNLQISNQTVRELL
uniref:Uncharacterized protein n=1 Tax=Papio anubis TaxID=9555 RepID=A0A8I5N7D2_PAPAN